MKKLFGKGQPRNTISLWNIQKLKSHLMGSPETTKGINSIKQKAVFTQNLLSIRDKQSKWHNDRYSVHYQPEMKYAKAQIYLLGN